MTSPASDKQEGIGCRTAILAGLSMLAFGLIVGGLGLSLILNNECTGTCVSAGLAMFYAGAPASALFGAIGGGIPIAWPLDAGVWISLGITVSAWSARLRRPVWHVVAAFLVLALVYGTVVSRFVEVSRA